MKGMTQKQKELLHFIREFIATHDYSPSLDEIKVHFGYRSLATVHQHLTSLKKKGLITARKNCARSLNLIEKASELAQIPIVGTLVSSHPIEFFPSIEHTYSIPKSQVPTPHQSYILQVRGDSLIHEHIQNLDLLLIEASSSLKSKEIGLFTLSSGSTLLRRYFPEDSFIRLEPLCFTSYTPTEIFRPHEIKIQGKLISLIRNY
ncbi:MAG: transcriptional repressor LexA [Simkaniaceae bacterium]|nr:transcriptional repressor LexA [Simkaniaceae bacterium]